MGISYMSCKYCDEAFPDVNDYICCECDNVWCCEECANKDGFINGHCKVGFECECEDCDRFYCSDSCDNYVTSSCSFCRMEQFEDYELLEFSLSLLGKTKEELVSAYKISREESE